MFDLLVSSQNENSFPFVSLEQQKKKAKALGHGQRKEAFSYSPTDKENCCSAITKLFGFACFFLTVIAGQNKTKNVFFVDK